MLAISLANPIFIARNALAAYLIISALVWEVLTSGTWLSAAGFGDCLCRSTAQIDWWTSHRLFATRYSQTPYALQAADDYAFPRPHARLDDA